MTALGAWITSVVALAATSFALPLLACVGLMVGIAFATGNRDVGKSLAVMGLLGVGIIMTINQIISSIPKPA